MTFDTKCDGRGWVAYALDGRGRVAHTTRRHWCRGRALHELAEWAKARRAGKETANGVQC